ncbi:MAG: nicotinamide-nucleotide amidohydrolase family protein [Desulfotomaculaceae bacterium]|nr:nicotinamide-nucleotide amidohydrolase family protein [Desulfotomaculaceae bacterium]
MKDELCKDEVARFRVFKLAGISEAATRELVRDLAVEDNASIGYLTGPGEIQVRITIQDNSANLDDKLEAISAKVKARLEDYIFVCDGEVIEDLVGRLLRQRGLTIALAESCTGGLIAARLTNTPGSSEYVKGGVVSYTNEIKEKLLGVPPDILEKHGAVSRETASAMAEGIRDRASSDIGLSVTGIAGPGGDTPDKPLGLVYIGLSTSSGVLCSRYVFPGNRNGVRQGTVNAALNLVRRFLS